MPLSFINKWFAKPAPPPGAPVTVREGRPWLLLITSQKRNQNYYRDLELARRFSTVWLSEYFPFSDFDHDLGRILAHLAPGIQPDWVWLNYHRSYTYRLTGWEGLDAPVAAFVGDPWDFTSSKPVHLEKLAFLRRLQPQVWVNPYPGAKDAVRAGLEDETLPLIDSYWAVPADIFRPRGYRRKYDVSVLGSLTANHYPFRNQVRNYLLGQRRLKFFKKTRVGVHDGETFARALNRCRASFTDASVFGYPLAKYFEIPACGALLFAQPLPDLEASGFRDGINFVAVTPQDFVAKMQYYLLDAPEEAARIAQAGAELVHSRHTWEKRVSELLTHIAGYFQKAWPPEIFQP